MACPPQPTGFYYGNRHNRLVRSLWHGSRMVGTSVSKCLLRVLTFKWIVISLTLVLPVTPLIKEWNVNRSCLLASSVHRRHEIKYMGSGKRVKTKINRNWDMHRLVVNYRYFGKTICSAASRSHKPCVGNIRGALLWKWIKASYLCGVNNARVRFALEQAMRGRRGVEV